MADKRAPDRESVRRDNTRRTSKDVVTRTPTIRGRAPGNMQEVTYEDEIGRKFVVLVDEGEDPAYGQIVGPQPLDKLNLPTDFMVRLHNELFNRRLLTYTEASRRPQDIQGAIAAAGRIDVQAILAVYAENKGRR